MSKLTDLINQVRKTDFRLGQALADELRDLANRRTFGLVFEQHQPENVELPGVHPQRGDKVHILPTRGDNTPNDPTLWQVTKTKHFASPKTVTLEQLRPTDDTDHASAETREVPLDDVIVVAETGDTIYPGLVQTGEVLNGPEDAPAHVVINAENSHALRMLTYTHAHSVDVIYIDPPYNTGAKDWKYNNDYVGSEDDYRHSKWLSFMQRRLEMAKQLLNPDDSVLIVTIDEKEYLRLGMLLEQTFPEAQIQMVTSVINRAGSSREGRFARVEEYIFYVFFGTSGLVRERYDMLDRAPGEDPETMKMPTVWFTAVRRGTASGERASWENGFYPVLVDAKTEHFVGVGEPLGPGIERTTVKYGRDVKTIWPLGPGGKEQVWRFSAQQMRTHFENGTARLGKIDKGTGQRSITYLQPGTLKNIEDGTYVVVGRTDEGSLELAVGVRDKLVTPRSVWDVSSHFARDYGTQLARTLLGEKRFDYPKSLYAVEDTLRFCLKEKSEAIVLDFFAGSGTTPHAVMRLNREDDGRRKSISVTNNEVSSTEQERLRAKGLRPGDSGWEKWGICDYVTKPRVTAAITGKTPAGEPVKGAYKFTDEFDMADGFAANARFFTLTYESAAMISQRLAFERVAPLLWLRAGQTGRVINDLGDTGWDIADTYAVIENTDDLEAFLDALTDAANGSEALKTVFVITDDDRQFQATARRLNDLGMDSHRLYASYLTNFEFTNGDAQ